MTLPNFFIVGAMKAATTSLAAYLGNHPDVFMCEPKEPSFFSREDPGVEELKAYERLFDGSQGCIAVGEASTDYAKAPDVRDVPKRLARQLPRAKIIYVVRDPISRIQSMYRHEVGRGRERHRLEEVVFRDSRYIDWSRYGYQMQMYLHHFPREQCLIVKTEDLARDALAEVSRIGEFLGVSTAWDPHMVAARLNRGDDIRVYPETIDRCRSVLNAWRVPRLLPRWMRERVRRRLRVARIDEGSQHLTDLTQQRIWELLQDDHALFAKQFELDTPLWDRPGSAGT